MARLERTAVPAGWDTRPCLGTDLWLWYGPEDGEPEEDVEARERRERAAKAVCASCPFVDPCLSTEMALPIVDQWGVRGGLTAEERKELIRARRSEKRRAA